ncbi:MAG: DUF4190 domain-containing protein [Mycobacteriales bacterium]
MSYQQGPPPGGYYPPPPPQGPPTNTLAIISLVGAFVFAPAGLICGIIARKQIRQSGEAGDGLALAGIIISVIQIVIGIIAIIFLIVTLLAVGTAVSHFPTPSPAPTF